MLPLPAPHKVLCFRVRFGFLTFGIFCFRFHLQIELVASASSFFSSKCFRFHKNLTASTSLLSMKQLIAFSLKKKQTSLVCKLLYLISVVDRAWHGMEDDFFIFHTGNFRPLHFHSILKVFHSIFHSILKFSSIPYFHTKKSLDWKQCNICFAALHLCNVVSNRS